MSGRKRARAWWGFGALLASALGVFMVGCDQITSITPSAFLPPLSLCTPIPGNCPYPLTADITANINGAPVIGQTYAADAPGNFNGTNGLGTGGPDNAFSFTLCNIRHITISTCGGATFDTVLFLRGDDCTLAESDGRPLGYSDDDCGKRSEISMLLDPGLYHVILDGYPGPATVSSGGYTLYITTP